MGTTVAPLDREAAQRALADMCAAAGLDPVGAELIRLGSNAMFRLRSAPLILRIGPNANGLPAAEREVAVAEWLAENDVPAVRVARTIAQPLALGDRVGTIWQSASDREEYGSTVDLARILRKLHALEPPSTVGLPQLDPCAVARRRIAAHVPAQDDRDFLNAKCDQLSERYEALAFVLSPGVIHGDASVGNVILDNAGRPLLSDLDGFCIGPREWDLVLTAMYFELYGWHTAEEYAAFVEVYEYDVMHWPGYEVMRDTRELLMVAWLAQKVSMDPAVAPELAKRIHALRSDGSRQDWLPL